MGGNLGTGICEEIVFWLKAVGMRFSRWRLADAGLKLTGFKWVLLCNGVVGSDHNFFTASRRDVHLTIYQRVLGAGSGVPTGRDFFLSAARR